MLPLLSAVALATVPMPTWPKDSEVLYHFETLIQMPRGWMVAAERNLEVKAAHFGLRADLRCRPAPLGRNTELTCTFDHLTFLGATLPKDQAILDRVFAEWSTTVGKTTVRLLMAPDGRLKGVDIDGFERTTEFAAHVHEIQTIVVKRAVSVLDLPLTADDKDWQRGWKQKGEAQIMGLPSSRGTVGSWDIKHRYLGDRAGLAAVETSGRGTLTYGTALDGYGTLMVDSRVGGESMFDPATGALWYREYMLDCRYTAASSEAGADSHLLQRSVVQRVEAFNADGSAPLPIAAQRASKRDESPAVPDGVSLVPFASLGMEALFMKMPASGDELGLPKVSVTARVAVAADGRVTDVRMTRGWENVATDVEQALKGARFPAQPAAYVVDVDVELRP
jgi:hypothetical protein